MPKHATRQFRDAKGNFAWCSQFESGAPERIRTSDPQIRSLEQGNVKPRFSCKPPVEQGFLNQQVTKKLQTDSPPEKENPGALAGATGAKGIEQTYEHPEYRYRLENARTLAFAIGQCDPRDACEIMAAALDDLSAGHPSAPLFSYMDHAAWWADLACEAELKAYLLACWSRLSPKSQAGFLDHIKGSAAA